jgi:hypothetical protein
MWLCVDGHRSIDLARRAAGGAAESCENSGVSDPVDSYAEPATVSLVTLDHLHGFEPAGYVGAVMATGAAAADAYDALGERALELARESRARHVRRGNGAEAQVYVVLGVRLAAGVTASGQPQWVAYGTLTRGIRTR